ncbi:MAG: NAD-dependent epimerase/dehydratase family protein [Bacteroidota bacterium]
MKILITGICGFVGSSVARTLKAASPNYEIIGIDNFIRPGSWTNRDEIKKMCTHFFHGDIRNESDLAVIPKADWVIDAAANPSVLAGIDGKSSSLQLIHHNVVGTINLLEYCKRNSSGFLLLSTSRVYSIPPLAALKMDVVDGAFLPNPDQEFPTGISPLGVSEKFSTMPPVSLYGSSKVVSEHLALEYGATFGFPVWINRCGVMAGAGQFGHPMQGIFAYWIHSFREKRPLSYIGFGGTGYQVRDCLHPSDLVPLLIKQMNETGESKMPRIANVSGGVKSAMSLSQLSDWCQKRIGTSIITSGDSHRPFDIPWMVLDSSLANETWDWAPAKTTENILEEIALFAETHENWCALSL